MLLYRKSLTYNHLINNCSKLQQHKKVTWSVLMIICTHLQNVNTSSQLVHNHSINITSSWTLFHLGILETEYLYFYILDSYHPTSNIPFVGKVVEKVLGWQLHRILRKMNYPKPFLLGFRLGCITDTCLSIIFGQVRVGRWCIHPFNAVDHSICLVPTARAESGKNCAGVISSLCWWEGSGSICDPLLVGKTTLSSLLF